MKSKNRDLLIQNMENFSPQERSLSFNDSFGYSFWKTPLGILGKMNITQVFINCGTLRQTTEYFKNFKNNRRHETRILYR